MQKTKCHCNEILFKHYEPKGACRTYEFFNFRMDAILGDVDHVGDGFNVCVGGAIMPRTF
jgi:hypothetical protein